MGTYSNANVGTGKTATIVYTLADGNLGVLAINYSLANDTGSGDITSANLVISDNATHSSTSVISGTATNLTLSGTGTVLTIDKAAGTTVNSLTTAAGAQVNVSQPLTVSTNVTVATGTKMDLTNTLTVQGDLILKGDQTSSSSVKVGAAMTITGAIKYLKTIAILP